MADNLPSPTEFRAGRSDSTASSSSTGSATGWANVKQQAAAATGTTPTTQQPRTQAQATGTSSAYPYRRPSHPLFEGLTAQKRKDDAASVARRQSLSEQRPSTGYLGKLWNNWVYGK